MSIYNTVKGNLPLIRQAGMSGMGRVRWGGPARMLRLKQGLKDSICIREGFDAREVDKRLSPQIAQDLRNNQILNCATIDLIGLKTYLANEGNIKKIKDSGFKLRLGEEDNADNLRMAIIGRLGEADIFESKYEEDHDTAIKAVDAFKAGDVVKWNELYGRLLKKDKMIDLSGANIYSLDLSADYELKNGINLEGADLRGADFRGTTLVGANLRNADTRGAEIFVEDLRYANLNGARVDSDLMAKLIGVEYKTIPGGDFIYQGEAAAIENFEIAETQFTIRQMKKLLMYREEDVRSIFTDPEWDIDKIIKKSLETVADDVPGNEKEDCPLVYINQIEAKAVAELAGGRLLDEREWERAASGTKGLVHPWEKEPGKDNLSEEHAVYHNKESKNGTRPVKSKEKGKSAEGVYDLIGNVWEWTSSWFDSDEDYKVIRGGSWCYYIPELLRSDFRNFVHPEDRDVNIGFRLSRTI